MASKRLSKFDRERICSALMRHTFSEREKALRDSKHALGAKVYSEVYTDTQIRLMLSLPAGFFDTQSWLKIQLGASTSSTDKVEFSQQRRVAHKHTFSIAKIFPDEHEVSKMWYQLREDQRQFRKEQETAKHHAMSVLNGCSTVNKLLESWPEIEPFLKGIIDLTSPNKNIVLPVKETNKLFGLTPEKK